jgi:hypothetical protein
MPVGTPEQSGVLPIQMIRLDMMIKDPRAQRPEDPGWSKKIAREFDRRLLGVFEVTARPDGKYAVNDGWHRRQAMMSLGYASAPCQVHRDLTIEEEARLFDGFNSRRNVRYIDRFFVRLTEGDEVAKTIAAECVAAGWEPSKARGTQSGKLVALASLERVYRLRRNPLDSALLVRSVLGLITRSWGHVPEAADGSLLYGFGLFLARYGSEVDFPSLVTKLAKFDGGPGGMVGRARTMRTLRHTSMPNAVAEVLTGYYNGGRRSHRLPEWRTGEDA